MDMVAYTRIFFNGFLKYPNENNFVATAIFRNNYSCHNHQFLCLFGYIDESTIELLLNPYERVTSATFVVVNGTMVQWCGEQKIIQFI